MRLPNTSTPTEDPERHERQREYMTTLDPSQIGQVSYDGKHATLTFQRRLPHPPEAVWAAITDPKQLAMWYVQEVTIDGRLGGSVHFVSGGGKLLATGRILAWDPPRLLEYEWKVKPRPEMPSGEDSVVRWELGREGDATVLTLTHRNLTRGKAIGAAPFAHVVLERLASHLDGQPFEDFVQRVAEMRPQYAPRRASLG